MNDTVIEVNLLKEDEIPVASQMIADYYWNEGFPIFSLKRDEKWTELDKLLKYNHTRLIRKDELGTTMIGQSMQGLALAWNYHPHAWNVKCADRRTPLENFCDKSVLEAVIHKILRRILKRKGSVTDNLLRKYLRIFTGSQGVSNFRPTAAAAIYRYLLPETGGVTWDMSSGFGGRLLGAIACKNVKKYIGSEPASETMAGLKEMEFELLPIARQMHRSLEVELHPLGSEKMRLPANSVDLCFTSPPYFDREKYSEEETQSWKKYQRDSEVETKEAWITEFMGDTLDNCEHCLKPDGLLAVNIADVDTYKGMEARFKDFAVRQKGWKLVEEMKLTLSSIWGRTKYKSCQECQRLTGEANGIEAVIPTFDGNWKKCPEHKYKYEPIYVFRRKQ
jgi:hypothetical protein